MMTIARLLSQTTSLTHIDLSGNEFSWKVLIEMIRAIQHNPIIQELKLSIFSEAQGHLPENGKDIKNFKRYHLSSQYNYQFNEKEGD